MQAKKTWMALMMVLVLLCTFAIGGAYATETQQGGGQAPQEGQAPDGQRDGGQRGGRRGQGGAGMGLMGQIASIGDGTVQVYLAQMPEMPGAEGEAQDGTPPEMPQQGEAAQGGTQPEIPQQGEMPEMTMTYAQEATSYALSEGVVVRRMGSDGNASDGEAGDTSGLAAGDVVRLTLDDGGAVTVLEKVVAQ